MTGRTVADWMAAMAAAPIVDPVRLIGDGGLVVLAPHPDDETLGAAGLLTAAGRLGHRIGLVALTDGEGSHRESALFPPERLAAVRVGEQQAAMAALGCIDAETLRLALPDGASRTDPLFEEAADRVAALCERTGATALCAPHPDDPHPDHHAAAELALRVRALRPSLRILFYEVWSRRLRPGDPFGADGLTPFRIATDLHAKRAALACHRSQLGTIVTDDPDGFVLPAWFLAAHDEPLERIAWSKMPGMLPGAGHFARLYAGDGDPWHVRTSQYEAGKRAASVEALSGRRYVRALEAGCGEGFLTRAMIEAGAAAAVVGFDRDPSIIGRARRMTSNPAATFEIGNMPDEIPAGPFDLVVLSEVLYFLDEAELVQLAAELATRMLPGAHVIVVSYLGPTDTPLGGRDAADFFAACLGADAHTLAATRTPDYIIELLEWTPGRGEVREADVEGPTASAASA